jgi:hypothetical protein
MIHDEIVTYEVAKLAKEKGFPQDPKENNHCDMYCWDGLRNIHPLNSWVVWCMEEYNHENLFAAPTQSLLQRWLREEKGVCIAIYPNLRVNHFFEWIGYKKDEKCWTPVVSNMKEYNTYELALEDALKYALENLV